MRHMAMIWVLAMVLIGGVSCQSGHQISAIHMLVDTSASLPPDLYEACVERVKLESRDWARHADSGERFEVWWLALPEAAYAAEHLPFKMPLLSPTAFAQREKVIAEVETEIEHKLADAAHSKGSHLLEALYLLSSTRTIKDSPWRLIVLSDLQQDSPQLNLTPARVRDTTSQALVLEMLRVCPEVAVPPSKSEFRT